MKAWNDVLIVSYLQCQKIFLLLSQLFVFLFLYLGTLLPYPTALYLSFTYYLGTSSIPLVLFPFGTLLISVILYLC